MSTAYGFDRRHPTVQPIFFCGNGRAVGAGFHRAPSPAARAVCDAWWRCDAAGAAIDLVEPGKTGWLFKNRSAEDLTRVLKEATDNPERLGAMRPLCRAKFEQWYGEYSPLVQVPKVVAELLAGRAAPAER